MTLIRGIIPFTFFIASLCLAAEPTPAQSGTEPPLNFQSEDTYMDPGDAVRSKQYLHRTILRNIVKDTSSLQVGRFFINHLMGFSQVWQRSGGYTKYSTGLQGLALGYVGSSGNAIELGVELSAVSNIYIGYKYFVRPREFLLWGFIGGGIGTEVQSLGFADGPLESRMYDGPTTNGFATLGLLVPLVDVAIKAEARFSFYEVRRIIFTQGLGVIIFL